MVEAQKDPMEPPKFKTNKKIPRGPPSPPAPVLHSPTRKVLFSYTLACYWKVGYLKQLGRDESILLSGFSQTYLILRRYVYESKQYLLVNIDDNMTSGNSEGAARMENTPVYQ